MHCNRIIWATLVALCFAPTYLAFGQEKDEDRPSDLDRRIDSTVREAGEVQSASHVEVRAMVEGATTVLDVLGEGTQVQEGDFLVQLDSSGIERKIEQQEIAIARSTADLIKAQTDYEAARSAQQRMNELTHLFDKSAALEQAALLEAGGELSMEIEEAAEELQLFEIRRTVARAKASEWQGKHPDQELNPELLLEMSEAENGIRRLNRRIAFLQGSHREQAIARLNLELARQRHELQQGQEEAESHVASAAAEVEALRMAHQVAKEQLTILETNLEHCQIVAPADGTVVYARVFDRRNNSEWIMEPGATVRERQPLIWLTDMSQLEVKTLVNESRIAMVQPGQAARIHLDALPGEAITGVVTRVNNYQEPTGWMTSESVRQYAVTVAIEDPPAFIRIGMNAMVEIVVGDSSQMTGKMDRELSRDDDANSRDNNPRSESPGGMNSEIMAQRTLDRFDTNQDGLIDQDELDAAPGSVANQLRQADTNGDEKLDKDELKAALDSMMRRFRDR